MNDQTKNDLKSTLSTQDFLAFGRDHVAYIRQIKIRDRDVFAVYAADGTPISMADTQTMALHIVAGHDLEPVRLH